MSITPHRRWTEIFDDGSALHHRHLNVAGKWFNMMPFCVEGGPESEAAVELEIMGETVSPPSGLTHG